MLLTPSLKKAILCMIAASLFFSAVGILVKISTDTLPFTASVFFRNAVGFVMLYLLFLAQGKRMRGTHLRLLGLRGVLGFVSMTFFFLGLAYLPLSNAVTLSFSSPIFVVLFSLFFLREKVHILIPLFVVIALIGATLIASPSFESVNIYSLLCIASALFAALGLICVRTLRKTDSPETITLYFMGVSTLLSIPLFLIIPAFPSLSDLPALIGIGVAATIGQVLLSYALKWERASILTAFTYLTPVFSIVFGLIIFGEMPGVSDFTGTGIVIVMGVAITLLSGRGTENIA
jgi:drug/metabolite transporter (DMT)-like permease